MRSLSVPRAGVSRTDEIQKNILRFAGLFAPSADFFLIDTLIGSPADRSPQPVAGYVGITGERCDWEYRRSNHHGQSDTGYSGGWYFRRKCFRSHHNLKTAGVDSCTKTNAVDKQSRPVRFKKDMKKVRRLVEEARRADLFLKRL